MDADLPRAERGRAVCRVHPPALHIERARVRVVEAWGRDNVTRVQRGEDRGGTHAARLCPGPRGVAARRGAILVEIHGHGGQIGTGATRAPPIIGAGGKLIGVVLCGRLEARCGCDLLWLVWREAGERVPGEVWSASLFCPVSTLPRDFPSQA